MGGWPAGYLQRVEELNLGLTSKHKSVLWLGTIFEPGTSAICICEHMFVFLSYTLLCIVFTQWLTVKNSSLVQFSQRRIEEELVKRSLLVSVYNCSIFHEIYHNKQKIEMIKFMLTWDNSWKWHSLSALSNELVSQCGELGFISCMSSLTAVDSFIICMAEESKLKLSQN